MNYVKWTFWLPFFFCSLLNKNITIHVYGVSRGVLWKVLLDRLRWKLSLLLCYHCICSIPNGFHTVAPLFVKVFFAIISFSLQYTPKNVCTLMQHTLYVNNWMVRGVIIWFSTVQNTLQRSETITRINRLKHWKCKVNDSLWSTSYRFWYKPKPIHHCKRCANMYHVQYWCFAYSLNVESGHVSNFHQSIWCIK